MSDVCRSRVGEAENEVWRSRVGCVAELRMRCGVEELGCGGAENEVWRS
jgi:hypothetical protein